jgi:hypothetical protein
MERRAHVDDDVDREHTAVGDDRTLREGQKPAKAPEKTGPWPSAHDAASDTISPTG